MGGPVDTPTRDLSNNKMPSSSRLKHLIKTQDQYAKGEAPDNERVKEV